MVLRHLSIFSQKQVLTTIQVFVKKLYRYIFMNEYKYQVSICLQNTSLKMEAHEISAQTQSKHHILMLTFASKAIKMSQDSCAV